MMCNWGVLGSGFVATRAVIPAIQGSRNGRVRALASRDRTRAQGMQLAGMRTHRLIPYSEEFLILTCPTTRTGYAKLDAARGIVVNGLRYGHPLMRFSTDAGKPVEVRYEPFDMSLAYVFVDGQ